LRSITSGSRSDRDTRSLIREGSRNPVRSRSDLTPVLEEMQQSLSEIKQNNVSRCWWIRGEDAAATKM
jgi:hypothetical protein